MSPDDVMLRAARPGEGAASGPLTPEERAEALKPARDLGLDPWDPAPFVRIGPDRKGKGVEIVAGVKGTF